MEPTGTGIRCPSHFLCKRTKRQSHTQSRACSRVRVAKVPYPENRQWFEYEIDEDGDDKIMKTNNIMA